MEVARKGNTEVKKKRRGMTSFANTLENQIPGERKWKRTQNGNFRLLEGREGS